MGGSTTQSDSDETSEDSFEDSSATSEDESSVDSSVVESTATSNHDKPRSLTLPGRKKLAGVFKVALAMEKLDARSRVRTLHENRDGLSEQWVYNEIRNNAFSIRQLRDGGFTAAELRSYGFPASSLRRGRVYSSAELLSAGFRLYELKATGISARRMHEAGATARELVTLARFPTTDLRDADVSATALRLAGMRCAEVAQGGYSPRACKRAGYTLQELKEAGFDAHELRMCGYSLSQLRRAGFTWHAVWAYCHDRDGLGVAALRRAGFLCSPHELRHFFEEHASEAAQAVVDGFVRLEELVQAGVTASMLRARGGFSLEELERSGVDQGQLRETSLQLSPRTEALDGHHLPQIGARIQRGLRVAAVMKGASRLTAISQMPSAKPSAVPNKQVVAAPIAADGDATARLPRLPVKGAASSPSPAKAGQTRPGSGIRRF